MNSANTSWKSLFEAASAPPSTSICLDVRVFKKAGESLLVIPRGQPALAAALELYPAQTTKARLARAFWKQAVRLGLALGAARDCLILDPAQPFVQFLSKLASADHDAVSSVAAPPTFALLAGNPYAPGRRFLLLVFSRVGQPVAVVKAGNHPAAVALVEKETSFLESVPAALPGIPQIRAVFREGPIHAFALDYVPGDPPRPEQANYVQPLLDSWLKAGRKLPIRELNAWARLTQAAAADPLLKQLATKLERRSVQAALFHGDLAPWNIKISRATRAWIALDWERGELAGPPAWDWFHYVLQPAMLVQRRSPAALVQTAEVLLQSSWFRAYAEAAGLAGCEREWLLAYLLYCRDVLRPAEGSPRLVQLLTLLAQKWTNH